MIARKSVLVLLQNLAGAVLGAVAIKVTSVYLGKAVIGEFQAALGFLGLLYFLTDLGFGHAHTKRVSEGMDPGDCLATFAVFKAVVTGAFVAVSLGVLGFRLLVLGKPLVDAAPVTFLVVLSYMAVKSVVSVPGSTFDARRETARGQLVLLAETVVRVALTIVVSLVVAAVLKHAGPLAGSGLADSAFGAWARANPAAAYGLAWFAGALVSLGVGLAYLPSSTPWGRFRPEILRSYWRYALPIFLVSAIHVISTYLDKAALAYFWSDVEVGRFSQPRAITGFLENLPTAVVLLLFPTISALHAGGRHADIEAATHKAERYVSMLVLPAVVVLIVYAEAVIRVALSAEWLDAIWTLRILAVYSLFIALTRPSVAVLLGVDRPGTAARIGVAMALTNIVLILVLVPPALRIVPVPLPGLADVGAALATAASGVVGFVLFRRAAGRPVVTGWLAKHVLAGLAMAALCWALALLVEGPMRAWHLVGFSVLGGGLYLAALGALGEFRRSDVEFFLETLHAGRLLGYVRGELGPKGRG